MAPRYETTDAAHAGPAWAFADAAPDDDVVGCIPDGQQGIVLGDPDATALLVVGTLEELRALSARLARLVASAPPERPVPAASSDIAPRTRVRISDPRDPLRPVGTVLEPSDVELVAAAMGMGEQVADMVFVEWPGGSEWEFVEDLEEVDKCERCDASIPAEELDVDTWLCAACAANNDGRVVV